MDRRTFLLGALALVGCAQSRPAASGVQSASAASASVSPSAAALVIGGDATPAGTMLSALLVGTTAGSAARTLSDDWLAMLDDGSISAAPVFAGTAWAALSDSDEPSDDVVGDLAGLVQPDVSVMAAGALDGGLVWMAPSGSAVSSLDHVAKALAGKAAAVPKLALERADGLPGLKVIYGAKVTDIVEDDPVARAALVTSGAAAFGAFRRTEYLGTEALRELADPEQMCGADPLVLAVNAPFADSDPDAVLALNAVMLTLTDADLIALQRQVAGGAVAADAARSWLVTKGLVK